MTLEARFWAKVLVGPTCWRWIATTDQRYGLLDVAGRMEKAHRVSWAIHNGIIPDGMQVLHRCDNTLCVRPDHLFLGTPADNARDRDRKGRQVAPKGEQSGMAKLTASSVAEIRASLEPDRVIAEHFGVTRQNIHYIRKRVTWRHLP